ncbi:pilus assembly protein [Corallococcus llansteffanensis]|uniref:Pilus assembly protein n=1 Tax=Corallococcus llansteffanensis TaxID=2316731 RepID=A0A3A8Q9B2_9BACT|nr:pilus assembly protein [Corallococcus llansteffanensis]RKH64768.1 pilus assembly protein [Corallococcus llansteffanensis]
MQPARLLRHGGGRGQALVLFSLTLLLLTLMVLMTLGFGMRAKERVEIQMAADAAAYSQAVSVARTFNAIAVMNRAQIANMVAMAGTQSLISYSGQHYAVAKENGCAIPDAAFSAADDAAGTQTRVLQGNASALFHAELALYGTLLTEHLTDQKLVKKIVQAAGSDLDAVKQGAAKSMMEVSGGSGAPDYVKLMLQERTGTVPETAGAVLPTGGNQGRATLNATMGSLGWTWVHNRPGGSAGFGTGGANGGGYGFKHYADVSSMDPSTYDTISGRNSWAHDHGAARTFTCPVNGQPVTGTGEGSWVMSDEKQTPQDQHVYAAHPAPGQGTEGADRVDERHTLGECNVCPGIWPYSVGFNVGLLQGGNPGRNDYGQPKLYAVVSRDYAGPARRAQPDPWNIYFQFNFAGISTDFDNSSPLGRIQPTGREDVQRNQVALSAGLAYYHRPRPVADGGGWREPPNFLNPFWRATLASAEGTTDDSPAGSLSAAGFTEHAAALRQLDAAGFRGGSSTGARY